MNISEALSGIHRVFLDTAPVIYHVEGNPAYQALTDWVFSQITDGRIVGVTSSITLSECLVHPYRRGDAELVQRFREVITSGTNTHFVGVDAVADRAAKLRARENLTLTDAFQVAAAIEAKCEAFLTNDTALKRVTDINMIILKELST